MANRTLLQEIKEELGLIESTAIVLAISFTAAIFIPGVAPENPTVQTILAATGVLFGIVVGFFINDLWARLTAIRDSVADEIAGLKSYYGLVQVLGRFKANREWAKTQVNAIENYIKKWIKVEWHEYDQTEPEFNAIASSLKDINEVKTNIEIETYSNIKDPLSQIRSAREKLMILGKDRLTTQEWSVVLALAFTLAFSLFYLKESTTTSTVFTGLLTAVVGILILVLYDLDNLTSGEIAIATDPYQKVLDLIGRPRIYKKKLVEKKKVIIPKGIKYRTID